jgi:DNA adenine methylase
MSAAAPFLKWAGGKRQLLPKIRELVPEDFGDYFEPFIGGGAVFFDLFAGGRIGRRARLGDSNTELIETYKTVRENVGGLIVSLGAHARRHSAAHYYAVRASRTMPGVPRASRMIYLNRTGFNGLYRVNKKGGFNVPFGQYANPTICDEENLRACARVLERASIVCADFEKTVLGATGAERGDFVYFDPPYVPVSETANFTSFTPGGFGPADQQRLADCARRLKSDGVRVLISNADVPFVRKLYKGFELHRVAARRNINSKGAERGTVGELLIR